MLIQVFCFIWFVERENFMFYSYFERQRFGIYNDVVANIEKSAFVLNQICAGALIRGNAVLQYAKNTTEQIYSWIRKVHKITSRLLAFKFSRNSLWLNDFDLVAVCSNFSILLKCYKSYLRELLEFNSIFVFLPPLPDN